MSDRRTTASICPVLAMRLGSRHLAPRAFAFADPCAVTVALVWQAFRRDAGPGTAP